MGTLNKLLVLTAVFLCLFKPTQAQSLRLRQALLASGDWLNDVDGDNIPGQAGLDYPTYASVPEGTSFRCKDYDYAGYFADVEADCQAYHVCFPDGRNASFLCVNGTVFHQRYFVCDWWFHFNCSHAPSLYDLNLFRKIPLPVLPPVRRRQFPGPIPQPKINLLTPAVQQRSPKKLTLNENGPAKVNRNEKRVSNQPADVPKENAVTNRSPISNLMPERKKKDHCNCQCSSSPQRKYTSTIQYETLQL